MEFRKIWLDILKGLGIVFVVVGHFCNIERMHDWIYSFHMPLFFFASGYLYRRKPILETIKNKFRTLMIPYFVLGMLTQLFYAINESFHAREADVGELMIGLLYGTYSSIVYNRVLWFLPTLFCITIIYSVLKISVWGGQIACFVTIILTMISGFRLTPGTAPWGIDGQVCSYFIYYFWGNMTAEHQWMEEIRGKNIKRVFLMTIVLICLNYFLSGIKALEEIPCITAIIGVAGWLYMSFLLEKCGMILERLGQASLCILCLHVPICEIITNTMVCMTDMTYETGKSELRYVFVRSSLTLLFCLIAQYVMLRIAPWMLGKKRVKEWKET